MVYRGGCVAEYLERSPSTYDEQIGVAWPREARKEAIAMTLFVGLDVSVKETAVCVVDDTGKVVCEQKVPTEPDDIVRLLASVGEDYGRIGIGAVQRVLSRLAPDRRGWRHEVIARRLAAEWDDGD
jgi:predicted NBD/HSP70 family sugar kinase